MSRKERQEPYNPPNRNPQHIRTIHPTALQSTRIPFIGIPLAAPEAREEAVEAVAPLAAAAGRSTDDPATSTAPPGPTDTASVVPAGGGRPVPGAAGGASPGGGAVPSGSAVGAPGGGAWFGTAGPVGGGPGGPLRGSGASVTGSPTCVSTETVV
jgi:hypothetical protein